MARQQSTTTSGGGRGGDWGSIMYTPTDDSHSTLKPRVGGGGGGGYYGSMNHAPPKSKGGWNSKTAGGGGGGGDQQQAGTPDTTPMMGERDIYFDDQGSQYTAIASNQSGGSGSNKSSSKQRQSSGGLRGGNSNKQQSRSCGNMRLAHHEAPYSFNGSSQSTNTFQHRDRDFHDGSNYYYYQSNPPSPVSQESRGSKAISATLRRSSPRCMGLLCSGFFGLTACLFIGVVTNGPLRRLWHSLWVDPDAERLNLYGPNLHFPSDFVWGAATSSYQIEGATTEGGRLPSIWDTFCHGPNYRYNNNDDDYINEDDDRILEKRFTAAASATDESDRTGASTTNSTLTSNLPPSSSMLLSSSSSSSSWTSPILDDSSGDGACDHYHKFQHDVDEIMSKQLGLKAYRFSISWSRILPHGTGLEANPDGVAFYNKLIDALLAKGIEPYVTLYHWDLPQALEDKYGGWLSSQIIHDFGNYARICYEAFGDRVINWITINEAWTIAVNGYNNGVHAPGHYKKASTETYLVGHHLLLAHARAVRIYRHEGYRDKAGLKRVRDIALLNKSSRRPSSSTVTTTPEQQQQHIPHNANPILSDKGRSYTPSSSKGGSVTGGRYEYGAQAHGFGKGRIGMSNCGDFRFPLREKNRSDMAAAERAMEFQMGWFTDPLYYGEYPASMRRELKHRLPQFTSEQRAQLIGSVDFIGLNHYSSLLATRGKIENDNSSDRDNYSDASEAEDENEEEGDSSTTTATLDSYDRHVATNHDKKRSSYNHDDDDALMEEADDDDYAGRNDDDTSPGYWYDMRVDLSNDPTWDLNYMNWPIVPEGCFMMLQWIADRYNNPPIYITENGSCENDDDGTEVVVVVSNDVDITNAGSNDTMSDASRFVDSTSSTSSSKSSLSPSLVRDLIDGVQSFANDGEEDTDSVAVVKDTQRRNYFEDYIRACAMAIEKGVNLKGYFAWSLMDNFEWQFGYQRRFGLYYVDFLSTNKTRTPKESALFYSKVIQMNGNNIPRILNNEDEVDGDDGDEQQLNSSDKNNGNQTASKMTTIGIRQRSLLKQQQQPPISSLRR